MEAKLLVLAPAEIANTEFALTLPVTLGRGRDAKLKVVHGQISRLHCELYEADGKLMAKDLGSLNGTFVNNERISETELPPGGILNVGSVVFRAIYGAMPEEGGEDSTVDFGLRGRDTVTNTSTVFGGQMPDFAASAGEHADAEPLEDFPDFTTPTAPPKPVAAPTPAPPPKSPASKTSAAKPAVPAKPAPQAGSSAKADDVDDWLTEDEQPADLPADDDDLQAFFKKT